MPTRKSSREETSGTRSGVMASEASAVKPLPSTERRTVLEPRKQPSNQTHTSV